MRLMRGSWASTNWRSFWAALMSSSGETQSTSSSFTPSVDMREECCDNEPLHCVEDVRMVVALSHPIAPGFAVVVEAGERITLFVGYARPVPGNGSGHRNRLKGVTLNDSRLSS